jgi:DNA helicase HerA-like ATPase
MTTVESRELAPPVHLPTRACDPNIAVLGCTTFRGRRERFGILPDDRLRHMAIIGKTGMGKTTLLQQLLNSDIRAGRGVALLDPHGDLCDAVLAAIPRARTNDVILFDAADRLHPVSFNLLACPRPEQRTLVASGAISAFKKLYGEFWGPRMEHILRNALLALLEVPGSTLVTLLRLLNDARFRQPLVAKLRDPVVRAFWQKEFAALPTKFQLEAVAPIQNKIGHFISSPLLRNILGQSRSSLDPRRVMDEGKILLVNLSKGKLGDDVSSLLGSFLVTALQLAAMSRADVSEHDRPDFFLYIDEFQNFATDSFATILSEARKYRLALTLANQYLAQLDEHTAAAVFGNVGTLVSFQVGADDAEPLATQFAGDLRADDLLRLPRYQAYIRLLINGTPSRPFSMRTLPPARADDPERAAIIRRTSRRRYAQPVQEVNAEIERAMATA